MKSHVRADIQSLPTNAPHEQRDSSQTKHKETTNRLTFSGGSGSYRMESAKEFIPYVYLRKIPSLLFNDKKDQLWLKNLTDPFLEDEDGVLL
jgi:hypothetical protein